jgi:hypothetical protein
MFVPMFGQYDFQGRIVSFLVRIANIFFRTIMLFVWFIFVLILFLIWLALPIFLAFIIINLISSK